MSLITHAFEDLAQSLRVLLEADARAHRYGLLMTDRHEAVGNIETAVSSVLNAFHSLRDAIQKESGEGAVDWYKVDALAFVCAVRNARHHNKANRIRTVYTYHAQESENPMQLEQYVFVDYPAADETGDTFDVYLSWSDLKSLLDLPRQESRIPSETCDLIRAYIGSEVFDEYCGCYGLPASKVFINLVPLIVNAAVAIVPKIKKMVNGESTESRFFIEHFMTVGKADTHKPEVNCGPFALPG